MDFVLKTIFYLLTTPSVDFFLPRVRKSVPTSTSYFPAHVFAWYLNKIKHISFNPDHSSYILSLIEGEVYHLGSH